MDRGQMNSDVSDALVAPAFESQMVEIAVPNFLLKLWSLIDDSTFNHCVGWDSTGFSFHIWEPYVFSKEVLPQYFKHNNLNSFVRQLNMYGFRKVANIERSGLKNTDSLSVEFHHPYFVRGHPELLQHIKRKSTHMKSDGLEQLSIPHGLDGVLSEVRSLRDKQGKMSYKLTQLEKNNSALWREVAVMRQQHFKQQTIVNKLLHFLASLVHPSDRQGLRKRPLLMISQGEPSSSAKRPRLNAVSPPSVQLATDSPSPDVSSDSTYGPIINDVTDNDELLDSFGADDMGSMLIPKVSTSTSRNSQIGKAVVKDREQFENDFYRDLSALTQSQNNIKRSIVSLSADGSNQYVTSKPYIDANLNSGLPLTVMAKPVPAPAAFGQQAVEQISSSSSGTNANSLMKQNDDWLGDGSLAQTWNVNEQSTDGEKSPHLVNDYLDFVQADLDVLRDMLNNGNFDLDPGDIDNLFTTENAEDCNIAKAPGNSSLTALEQTSSLANTFGQILPVSDDPIQTAFMAAMGDTTVPNLQDNALSTDLFPGAAFPVAPLGSSVVDCVPGFSSATPNVSRGLALPPLNSGSSYASAVSPKVSLGLVRAHGSDPMLASVTAVSPMSPVLMKTPIHSQSNPAFEVPLGSCDEQMGVPAASLLSSNTGRTVNTFNAPTLPVSQAKIVVLPKNFSTAIPSLISNQGGVVTSAYPVYYLASGAQSPLVTPPMTPLIENGTNTVVVTSSNTTTIASIVPGTAAKPIIVVKSSKFVPAGLGNKPVLAKK